MFNLSDKDLDRLSQEAAQQHEPGDVIGPKFWDKLEARLDRDLGKVNPNPGRGIRRLPYYYAPAILVLLGVTYYLVRVNGRSQKGTSSGSPPLTIVNPAPAEPLQPASSSQNPVPSSKNSTLTEPSNTVQYPGTADAPAGMSSASAHPGSNVPATSARPNTSTASRNAPVASTSASPSPNPASHDASTTSIPTNTSPTSPDASNSPSRRTSRPPLDAANRTGASQPSTLHHHHNRITGSNRNYTAELSATTATSTTAATAHDLTFSAVSGPVRLANRGFIDDSALRAYNLATIPQPIHKDGLRINRSLEIGIVVGPDYTSVNSLAGDRPGSTIGITVDYQIANHLYFGTGLLFTKKVFAAASQDYKVPPNYYRQYVVGGGGDVAYIKGSFNMLEIPLNLRYDFSTAGNPTFFVNVGTSSYLFTKENCGYYFSLYNPRTLVTKGFTYTNYPDNLFASLNLSMGAEFGISNSLSAVLSPYIKIPTRGIGFGQVQLSSVGIDFAIRFAPVLSRRR